ncbi:MAG: pentapeptide repeat-containing protein [Myxococcales bacterium]|nr:pentapeptide repeat-containing protein [Myxococcales bacterium]
MRALTDSGEAAALIERSIELDELHFANVDLRRVSFAHRTLSRCTFSAVSLQESLWAGALIEDCSFVDCDLAGARLAATRLRDATFRRARLMGVDFSTIGEFPAFSLDECDVQLATFVGLTLRKLRCRSCRVTDATFERCDLAQSDFRESDLRGTRFERCDLTRADLSTATGVMIDPTQNKVKGAKISRDSAALVAAHFGFVVGS